MENENLSARGSLLVIQSMIDKTKENLGDNSIYFLLWGWLVFIGCLLQYFLLVIVQYPKHYYAWLILIPGVISSIVHSIKHKQKRKVKTYVEDSMGWLWAGMSFSFTALVFILSKIGWNYAFPFYILLYATGTFISGGLLQFKPLQIGGDNMLGIGRGSNFCKLSKSNSANCCCHSCELSYSRLFIKV